MKKLLVMLSMFCITVFMTMTAVAAAERPQASAVEAAYIASVTHSVQNASNYIVTNCYRTTATLKAFYQSVAQYAKQKGLNTLSEHYTNLAGNQQELQNAVRQQALYESSLRQYVTNNFDTLKNHPEDLLKQQEDQMKKANDRNSSNNTSSSSSSTSTTTTTNNNNNNSSNEQRLQQTRNFWFN